MKRLMILLLITLPLFANCQNPSSPTKSWINNPPESKDKIFGVGVGTSTSEDIAERKAHLNGSANLAKQVEPAVVSVTSRIDSIVRGNKLLIEKSKVIRKTVVANLNNVTTSDIEKIEKDGIYTVYVLLNMPKKEITRKVVDQIKQDKELYSAVAKTKTYKKIVKEIK